MLSSLDPRSVMAVPLPSQSPLQVDRTPDFSPFNAKLGSSQMFHLRESQLEESGFRFTLLDGAKTPILDFEPQSLCHWYPGPSHGFAPRSLGVYRVLGNGGEIVGTLQREVTTTDPSGSQIVSVPLWPLPRGDDTPRGLRRSAATFFDNAGHAMLISRTVAGFPIWHRYPLLDEGATFPSGSLQSRTNPPTLSSVVVTHSIPLVDGYGRQVTQAVHEGFLGMSYEIPWSGPTPPFPFLIHLLSVLLEAKATAVLASSLNIVAATTFNASINMGGAPPLIGNVSVVQDTAPQG